MRLQGLLPDEVFVVGALVLSAGSHLCGGKLRKLRILALVEQHRHVNGAALALIVAFQADVLLEILVRDVGFVGLYTVMLVLADDVLLVQAELADQAQLVARDHVMACSDAMRLDGLLLVGPLGGWI